MMKWFDQYVKGKDRGVKPGNLIRAFRIAGADHASSVSLQVR